MTISDEFKNILIKEGIDPLNVIKLVTKNNKKKKIIITEITIADNTKYKIINDYIWYAARKNKRW